MPKCVHVLRAPFPLSPSLGACPLSFLDKYRSGCDGLQHTGRPAGAPSGFSAGCSEGKESCSQHTVVTVPRNFSKFPKMRIVEDVYQGTQASSFMQL